MKYAAASNSNFGSGSRSRHSITTSPKIYRIMSVIVKKPYRELNDLQHLHHFSVSPRPIWVIKFR